MLTTSRGSVTYSLIVIIVDGIMCRALLDTESRICFILQPNGLKYLAYLSKKLKGTLI